MTIRTLLADMDGRLKLGIVKVSTDGMEGCLVKQVPTEGRYTLHCALPDDDVNISEMDPIPGVWLRRAPCLKSR